MSYYLDQAKNWLRESESDWAGGHQPTAVRKAVFAIGNALIALVMEQERANRGSLILRPGMAEEKTED